MDTKQPADTNIEHNAHFLEASIEQEVNKVEELIEELVDLEEHAKHDRKPPRARHYRIRIDRDYHIVDVPQMTGRQLLMLAGKNPPERYEIMQKFRGGRVERIGLNQDVDFTTHGVERFVTLPLDQTEGC
jgi:hypothetical protein